MKTKSIISILTFLVFSLTILAASKTEKFKVNGKCDMCKNRIETATKTIEGVMLASWDKSTKNLTVNYEDKSTTKQIILTSIVMAGHDNEMFSASDSGYNELP
ncbi:MAG TPA: heavy-metal-associated domain-containing protein [Prolixibacteraceae bacterium]|nr:heavy-metal-associated domain-containing protein [Prolixibacteraceae bacterium]